MKKNLLWTFVLLSCFANMKAQERDNLRLSAEFGFPLRTASDNLGLLFNAEPKLKVFDKAYVGMRLAMVINSQTLENHDSTQFIFDTEFDHGFFSIVPTLDYYFLDDNFRPYIGIGVGPYSLLNNLDVLRVRARDPDQDVFVVKVGHRFGGLIRGGFEYGIIRFGLEYNFVPQKTMSTADGEIIGTVNSSYLGAAVGIVLSTRKR